MSNRVSNKVVLLFSSYFGSPVAGGGIAFSATIVHEWLMRGYRVHVACAQFPNGRELKSLAPFAESQQLQLEELIPASLLDCAHAYTPAVHEATRSLLARIKPTEIHVHNFQGMLAGLWAAVESGVPTVYTALDFGLECPTWYLYDGSNTPCSGSAAGKCGACVLATNRLRARDLPYHAFGVARRFLGLGIAHGHKQFISLPAHAYWRSVEKLLPKMKGLFARFDHVIAPSPPVFDTVVRNRGHERGVHSLLYPVPDSKVRPVTQLPPAGSPVRLVFFGHSSPIKGWGFFLKVLEALPDGLPLEVVDGNGNAAYFRNAGQRARRYLKECQRENDVTVALANADAVLVPSLWHENTPLVVIEALANQRPVIASDQRGIRNVVKQGENGFLFAPGNLASWTQGISEIARDANRLRAMRAQCRYDVRVPRYVDQIEALVSHGNSP